MNGDTVKPKRTPAIIPQFFRLWATGVAEAARQMLEARTLRASPFRSDSGRQRTSRHRAAEGDGKQPGRERPEMTREPNQNLNKPSLVRENNPLVFLLLPDTLSRVWTLARSSKAAVV